MKPTAFRHCLIGFSLFCLFSFANAFGQEKQIGFVLEMNGEWLVNGKPIQKAGERLPAGGLVALSPKATFPVKDPWKITIILLNNAPLPYSCATFQECKSLRPITLPASLSSSSFSERLNQAVSWLLSLNPDRYVPAHVRDGPEVPQKLKDGVLEFDKSRIVLGASFQDFEPGSYVLTFVYIGRKEESKNPVELDVDWVPGRVPFVPAEDLTPGLYAVRVFRGHSARTQPVSQDAWILLSDSDQFPKSSKAFRNAAEATRQWNNTSAVDAQTFLRLCLDNLADPASDGGAAK